MSFCFCCVIRFGLRRIEQLVLRQFAFCQWEKFAMDAEKNLNSHAFEFVFEWSEVLHMVEGRFGARVGGGRGRLKGGMEGEVECWKRWNAWNRLERSAAASQVSSPVLNDSPLIHRSSFPQAPPSSNPASNQPPKKHSHSLVFPPIESSLVAWKLHVVTANRSLPSFAFTADRIAQLRKKLQGYRSRRVR
jgi:hypothetical protein